MSGSANRVRTGGESGGAMLALARRQAASPARRVVTAEQLMATQCGVVLPCLATIPFEQRFVTDERETIALLQILVDAGIASVEDWPRSKKNPTKYVMLTLERWIRDYGGLAIDRRFDLEITLSDRLVDYAEERGSEDTLYLIADPNAAAFVVLNPVIDLLEKTHPRLPTTFYNIFAGSLNRWVRVYDCRDAEERVEMLREWYEGEENADQYELPDVEGCTPKCFKEKPLNLRALDELSENTRSDDVKRLIEGLLALRRTSTQTKRPEFTDEMGRQLMDGNPPLPCLLAAFSQGDAVVGCFDDESQSAMEATPDPNLIIPLNLADPLSVRQGFLTLAVACETLAAASRLIDLMPGNNEGVIRREG
jgi:hypothetical protein